MSINYYVTINGSGANVGTIDNPWRTLTVANAAQAFIKGDIINCQALSAGNYTQGQVIWTGNMTGVTIQQIPGAPAYEQRNSVTVTGFSGPVAGVYTKTLATGLAIRGVSWNYGVSVTANGSRFGFLTLAASAAAVVSAGNYFYQTLTGLLTIHVGADPATGTVEYGLLSADNVGVVQFNQLTDVVVTGLTVSYGLMNNGEGQFNNGMAATTCTRTVWTANNFYDCGNHCTLMSGGTLTDNRISGNTYHGAADSSIINVFFSTAGSSGSNEANDNTLFVHGYLNFDGSAQRDTMNGIGAFFSHTGSGNIDNLTYRRNTVTYLFNLLGSPFTANNATAPGTNTDFTAYSIKFIDCVLRGGRQGGMTSGNVAYVNCDLDYANTFNVTNDYSVLLTGSETFGYFGCLVTSTSDYIVFDITGTCVVVFDSCTIINRDATSITTQALIASPSGTPTVTITRCLGAYTRVNDANGKTAYSAGGATYTGTLNAWYNLTSTTGDTSPTTISTNPFTAISTSGELTAVARKIKHAGANPSGGLTGIGHRQYVRNYGAYQYPTPGVRSRKSFRSTSSGGKRSWWVR